MTAHATDCPTACGEIDALIGELYDVERLIPGRFPGDAAAHALRHQLQQERSRLIADRQGVGDGCPPAATGVFSDPC